MRGIIIATTFLTRIPLSVDVNASDVGRASRWFPVVGAGLGSVAAILAWGLDALGGVPPMLNALLLVGLCAWATGALHLDGLADTVDGFGGGRDRLDVLRIMRDPVIGSFGAVALIFVVGIKAGALCILLERQVGTHALIVAPTVSRWTIVALSAWLPYARPEGGLGDVVIRHRDASGLLCATAITAAVTIAAMRTVGIVLWVAAALVMGAVGRTAWRRIGGITGDVFGASVELTEATVLMAAVVLTGPGFAH